MVSIERDDLARGDLDEHQVVRQLEGELCREFAPAGQQRHDLGRNLQCPEGIAGDLQRLRGGRREAVEGTVVEIAARPAGGYCERACDALGAYGTDDKSQDMDLS